MDGVFHPPQGRVEDIMGASSKPGSVVGDHLSEERLAAVFTRPYPRVGGQLRPLLFGLAPGGVFLA